MLAYYMGFAHEYLMLTALRALHYNGPTALLHGLRPCEVFTCCPKYFNSLQILLLAGFALA